MNNKYNNLALLCALATLGTAHAVPYVENGRTGDPDSWRSTESVSYTHLTLPTKA